MINTSWLKIKTRQQTRQQTRQERDRSETKNNNVNKGNKEKKRKKESSGEPLFYFPWLPDEQWQAYKEMRKSMRKQMTNYAEKLALNKLQKFHESGFDVAAILENSIINNYQGLYAPKGNQYGKPTIDDTIRKIALRQAEAFQGEHGEITNVVPRRLSYE